MGNYSMPSYFQDMHVMGKVVKPDKENELNMQMIEREIEDAVKNALHEGRDDKSINASGQLTAMQRIQALVDKGTWCPLNSLYNPEDNSHGTTGVIKGLGRIHGKWVVVIASDNKKLAGAWIGGQSDNLLRGSDTAKILKIPLVYLLNCSGVKLDEQEKVYANRQGGGTPFYRNAELEQLGIPVIVGIFGTNPAGGGYHSISPTILIAHSKANMAVGGDGILSGMNPKGFVDMESAHQIIDAQLLPEAKEPAPGSIGVHYDQTGFIREVYEEELGVVDAIKKYIEYLPAYNLEFFRVDIPKEPVFSPKELYDIIPFNQKRTYDIYEVIGRLFDGGEFMEYKKGYGPEIVAGLAKVNGLLTGVVANAQGLLLNYPEYKEKSAGIGGKLYRQGLIKMNEFVTLCSRDRIPMIWIQDTTGIDVGNEAECAELLGLGQSLIYSIENSNIPQMEITMRKGTAAAHYVLGGPQGNHTNAFSLGTAVTEIYVMNGETAANAMYSRRLAKDYQENKDLKPTIDKMNQLIEDYKEKSRPQYCAKTGLVDEIVAVPELRRYIQAFAESAYQNPGTICPFHQMMTPRVIKDYSTWGNDSC